MLYILGIFERIDLFFFDVVSALSFVYLLFGIDAAFTLGFGLTLVVSSVVLGDFIAFFTHFALVLQALRISEGVETMISRGTSWGNASYHHDFAC